MNRKRLYEHITYNLQQGNVNLVAVSQCPKKGDTDKAFVC